MDKMILLKIGQRIQQCRKSHGLTQEALAERMGVSIQMISNLERGKKAIRIDNLIRLCEILQVSSDYLLTGREGQKETQELQLKIKKLPSRERAAIELMIDYLAKNE